MWNPFQSPNSAARSDDDAPAPTVDIDPDEVPIGPESSLDHLLAEHIRDALVEVIDPEVGINIVDLGLVYAIHLTDDAVEVVVTATTPACPMADAIRQDVRDVATDAAGGDCEVRVFLIFEPKWQPEFMSDSARQRLGGGGVDRSSGQTSGSWL